MSLGAGGIVYQELTRLPDGIVDCDCPLEASQREEPAPRIYFTISLQNLTIAIPET